MCCWPGTGSGEPGSYAKACCYVRDWDPAVLPLMCSCCPAVSTKCSDAKVKAVA